MIPSKSSRPLWRVSAALLLALAGPAGAAMFEARAGSTAHYIGDPPVVLEAAAPVRAESSAIEAKLPGFLWGGGLATASSFAEANVAGLHLLARARVDYSHGPGLLSADAWSSGRLGDMFRLDAPAAYHGTAALMTVGFEVSGGLFGGGSEATSLGNFGFTARSSWESELVLGSGGAQVTWSGRQGRTVERYSDIVSGTAPSFVRLTLPVTVGDWVGFNWTARTEASVTVSALLGEPQSITAVALADLGHTFAWKGIESVVDQDGNAIPILSAISADTGFDYRNAYVAAVPEPATWMLWALAVAAGLWRRRSARH